MSYAASMNADEFKNRTKAFAIRVIRLVEALPQNQTAKVIGNQLLRCGTSVGANYRAACRAKSLADFVAKMAIVEEECDESIYWMELIVEAGLIVVEKARGILKIRCRGMNDLGQEPLEPVRYRSRAMSPAPTTVFVLTAASALW